MSHPDVVVVGGGVIGCASAYFLSRAGVSVTLLERDDLAVHASGAAAGMLAPLAEASEGGPLLRFGLESLERFPDLVAELRERSGVDPEFEASGILRVATSGAETERLRRRCETLAPFGVTLLDSRAAREREPALAPDVGGALWSPREGHVRSPLLVRAYAGAAERLGAHVRRGTPALGFVRKDHRVLGVDTPDGPCHAACVVLANGPWAADSAAWLAGAGPPLPVVPVRGQILSLDGAAAPLRAIVWGEGAYLVPKRDGSVAVGATEEHVGFDCRVTASGLRGLLAAAPRLVPGLADAEFLGAWAGLRPDTPDHLPAVGAWPGVEGLFVAAGHHRNGVLLSPVTGQLVADLVRRSELSDAARAFRPGRWFPTEEPAKTPKG